MKVLEKIESPGILRLGISAISSEKTHKIRLVL